MKVFGVGLSRTGTVSLTKALQRLRLRALHYPRLDEVLRKARRYDALTDVTVIPHYKELARLYPDAKFVLTVRGESSWLASCEGHWGRNPLERKSKWSVCGRVFVYGVGVFDAGLFAYVRQRHHDDVRQHFRGSDRLLELNVCVGEGYGKLCPFLGMDVLEEVFPHANKG